MAGNTQHGYIDLLAYEGQILTNRGTTERIGGRTVTGLKYPFGRGITWNGSNKEIRPLNNATDVMIGVLIRQPLYEDYIDADGAYGFPPNENVIFLQKGDIAVYVETDIAHNDPVYVRHTANGAGKDKVGVFRNDADTDNALLVPNARWLPLWDLPDGAVAKAGGIACLSLN